MTYSLPNVSTDLKGRVALVTGASSGLGLRFAKVLAACGAKVAIAARRADRLETLAAEIRNAGGEALPVELDVTDADQLVSAVTQAEKATMLTVLWHIWKACNNLIFTRKTQSRSLCFEALAKILAYGPVDTARTRLSFWP
jgi:NAD(P)-dependent dehydrogenase (short-subunit alcohol dehydrogenase family)